MNEKQMLELAAKAAGLKYHAFVNDPFIGYGLSIGDLETPIWNPLTDDGDALRLAVKLGLEMSINLKQKHTTAYGLSHPVLVKIGHGDDPYAATRCAITRAAAEIGGAL